MAYRIPGYTDPQMTPYQAAPNAYSSYGIHPCENGARFLLPQDDIAAEMVYEAYSYGQKMKVNLEKKKVKKTVLKLKMDQKNQRSEEEGLLREKLWKKTYAQNYSPQTVGLHCMTQKELQREELWKEKFSIKYQGIKRVETPLLYEMNEKELEQQKMWKMMKKKAQCRTEAIVREQQLQDFYSHLAPQFPGYYPHYY